MKSMREQKNKQNPQTKTVATSKLCETEAHSHYSFFCPLQSIFCLLYSTVFANSMDDIITNNSMVISYSLSGFRSLPI